MLKRLIIAVFALSLVLSLSGTAFSDVSKPHQLERHEPANLNHPNFSSAGVTNIRPPVPSQRIDINATGEQVFTVSKSKPASLPSGYFCDALDNSGALAYFWTLPNGAGTREAIASRYTVEPGITCTVSSFEIGYYGIYSGTPGARVILYDDDGFGLPGTKLDSVDYTYGQLYSLDSAGGGNLVGSFPGTWTFTELESYHIGFMAVGSGQVTILSDDGVTGPNSGSETGSLYYNSIPGWASSMDLFVDDYAFYIVNHRCCADIPFTDCYTQSYWANISYSWSLPNLSGTRTAIAMRFSVAGPETLKSADVFVYFADPGVDITASVYNDAGGFPTGAPLASVTVLNGSLAFFPAAQNFDFSSFNLVMENDFHIVVEAPGAIPSVQYAALLSDDGASATGRGSAYVSGVWQSVGVYYGLDAGYLIDANMCKDEFSICTEHNDHYDAINGFLRLPRPDWGVTAWAQQYTDVGENCEVRRIDTWWAWHSSDGARSLYDSTVHVDVYSDAGGLPGTLIGGTTITPADFNAAGDVGFTGSTYWFPVSSDVDPLDIFVTGAYWVVLTNESPSFDAGGARPLLDADGSGTSSANSSATYDTFIPGWQVLDTWWPLPGATILVDVKTCCVPFSEYTCQTAQDWSTPAGNFARTGRTDVSISDSWCDLNLRWYYEHPSFLIAWGTPTTYNGKVAQVWTGELKVFDLLTGANLWSASGAPRLGTNMRCSPTAATIGGVDVLFTAGGNQQSVTCWDLNTGTPLWNRPGPSGSGGGAARYGIFVLANQAGTDVLYALSETGKLVAIDAATGALFGGWGTNPVSLPGAACEVSLSYNANDNLIYAGDNPASGNGDIYAIDAATGAIVWQLSTSGGLQASVLYSGAAAATGEQFTGYASYENGFLYANSKMNVSASAQYPADGIYYKLNATTGALVHSALSQRMWRSAPIIDQNNAIIPTISVWSTPSLGANVIAFSKAFGIQTWTFLHPNNETVWLPGVLTCEPGGEPDQVMVFGDGGFLLNLNANTGAKNWERRMEFAQVGGAGTRGFGVALSKDGELAVSHEYGGLAVLGKGADRQRLEFIHYTFGGGVNFGTNPALPMNLGWAAKNTGCLPLNINAVTVDAASPSGQGIPSYSKPVVVGNNLLTSSAAIAEKMTANGWSEKLNPMAEFSDVTVASLDKTSRRELTNRAALAAPPAWFVSLDDPGAGDVINPGDSVELMITVNQNFISRGPNVAYVAFDTDDPDFFLNDPALDPEVKIQLVGGCLTDTSTLTFGMGSANYEWVWNMGRLGDGDATAHGWHIDGDNAQYYQGSYIYSVSQRRYASNSSDWSGATTLEWFSLQGDPNWCDGTCKPALVSPYAVPPISNDGLTYTPITASMVCRNYLDSVQYFDLGGGWSVENEPAGFDNDSTMGLYVQSRMIAATNEASLSNVTIDLMEINERNGNAVTGWYFGSYNDFDIGGGDTSGIDKSVSTAYAWNKSLTTGVWGQIKLPFGCGQTPIINTHGMQGAQALYTPDQYFDSQYVFMTNAAAHTSQITSGGDFEQHNTFVQNDFAPNGTVEFGIAHFGFPAGPHGGSGNTAHANVKALARLVNKWVGFGRGDVNNDNVINLADVVYLAGTVNFGGPGAIPFAHLGDVNASGGIDQADVDYLINFYFSCGPCPTGDWTM